MDGPHQSTQSGDEATSGIVLLFREATVDPTLAVAMTQRGWTTTSLDDPCLAMAELCLLERGQAARAAWGLNGGRRLVLVLADNAPSDPLAEALVDAVRWYLPDVAIWRAQGASLTRLDPDIRADATDPRPPPAPVDAEPEAIAEHDDREPPPTTEITVEEIDMLFGTPSPETLR
jgi:hypothetical protein